MWPIAWFKESLESRLYYHRTFEEINTSFILGFMQKSMGFEIALANPKENLLDLYYTSNSGFSFKFTAPYLDGEYKYQVDDSKIRIMKIHPWIAGLKRYETILEVTLGDEFLDVRYNKVNKISNYFMEKINRVLKPVYSNQSTKHISLSDYLNFNSLRQPTLGIL